MKKIFSLTIVVIQLLLLSITANANGPKGDLDYNTENQSLVSQFDVLLDSCTSEEERYIVLKKACDMGLQADEISMITVLSNTEKNLFKEKNKITHSNIRQSRIIKSTNPGAKVTVAGVSMPDYALWPTIYKQATSSYCSAATIYTAGSFIGANPPSQATIMNTWQTNWGVTLPDLPLMRNYMNNVLPGKPSDYVPYVHRVYSGNQTTFNTDLKNNVLNYQPMILLMRNNTTSTTNWPYKTSGHFCICSGLLTWESNKYFIGDPYYFSSYVSGATANNGEHKKTWTQLNTVITNRFGSGNQAYVT